MQAEISFDDQVKSNLSPEGRAASVPPAGQGLKSLQVKSLNGHSTHPFLLQQESPWMQVPRSCTQGTVPGHMQSPHIKNSKSLGSYNCFRSCWVKVFPL